VEVLSAKVVGSIPSATPGNPFKAAGGELLALKLRVADVGRAGIVAIDAMKAFSIADTSGRLWQLTDTSCKGISASYAAKIGAPMSPNTVLVSGEAGTTAGVYAVPSGSGFKFESKSGQYVPLSGS
jgi:hypothetical protein